MGIPTVSDRVIQQAIAQKLVPVFDPHFSESSYGYRPGRSAHQAIKKVNDLINQGYRYAVDIDLAKFFDNVNWDILMSRVARRVMASVTKFLEKNLKVQVNRDKSKVGTAESSIFLSFTFHLKRPTVSRKAFTSFKSELKRLTGRSWAYPCSDDTRKSAPIYRGG